ncbi:MAG TPA: outer membrane protein assembly factor BamA [Burkholderiales bacterium]|nr:outer membrane protein assembly factor BamA [Burkholderiales bacterium]
MRFPSLVVAAGVLLFTLASGAFGQAFHAFVIKDIRVDGLQRTEPGTVFSYLPVKVGETLTEEKAQQAVRALFATGFFRDVRLEVENDVLVVIVEERPAIAQIDFVGVKEFETENLRKIMRDVGLADGRTFDRSVLDRAEQELKRQYLSRGLYAADVQTTVTPLERNRVGITITVNEGSVAKIRAINIVGDRVFSEKELLDQLVLRTPGWLTWYTKADQYSKPKLSADLETLKAFYQNRGYLDFNVESTQVSITPDKRDIYLTINIFEGEKYTVSAVRLDGQMLVPREQLEKLIRVKAGATFSRQLLTESTKAITDRLGNDGYAFANANAVPQIDKEKRTVAFTIVIDPGRRVYVRRINVGGNTKTRDEVVRREMRQLEGAYYDASKIQLSKTRIDRTQYFKDVNVETAPVADSPDQVDVNFTVEEKPTGAITLGAGYSTVDKVVLQAGISQTNIFGSGKYVGLNMNTGSVNRNISLSYLNPYLTVDGVSQGFDVYNRKVDASNLALSPYTTNTYGGGVKFGYPLSETDAVSFGLNAEDVTLGLFPTSAPAYLNFQSQFGDHYVYGAGNIGWARDGRDSAILPTRGYTTRIGGEVAGGNLEYYRLNASQTNYFSLSRTMTLSFTENVGYINGLGGKPVPFFKTFYAGGPGSVRGYRAYSLGSQDAQGNSLGGTKSAYGSAELYFPVPGAEKDKSLRLSTFLDAGQVYDPGPNIAGNVSGGGLRYSAGVGISWNSPFGPLKVSLAQPLNAKSGFDHIERLQLNFGTTF